VIYSLILLSWDDYPLSIREMRGSLQEMWIRGDKQREGFRRLTSRGASDAITSPDSSLGHLKGEAHL
jgi:hypothetical protein